MDWYSLFFWRSRGTFTDRLVDFWIDHIFLSVFIISTVTCAVLFTLIGFMGYHG